MLGYMQIPGIDHKESLFSIATARLLGFGIYLTFNSENCICELVNAKADFSQGEMNTKL